MNNRTTNTTVLLQALGAQLKVHGFGVEQDDAALLVASPEGAPKQTIRILCMPRAADRNRLWFFTADGMPISEADHLIEALVIVKGLLAVREGV